MTSKGCGPNLEDLLKRNKKLKREDVEYLQSWMSKQPHLPQIPDEMLVCFLHCSDYSRERAKHLIENHFTIRTHIPYLFRNRDPLTKEAKKQMTLAQAGQLLKKDADGNIVWIAGLKPGEPSELDVDVCLKLVFMAVDQVVREDPTCEGHIVVVDFKGVTLEYVGAISLRTVKHVVKYMQEGLNFRFKAVHLINASSLVDYVLQLFKPFLNKEFLSMIHIHSGPIEEFYKVFPQDILPKDYGGHLGDMDTLYGNTLRSLENAREWFLQNEFLVDEAKRRGKSKNAEDIFGVEGSFKKLDID